MTKPKGRFSFNLIDQSVLSYICTFAIVDINQRDRFIPSPHSAESMKASFSADRPFKHLRFDFQPTVKSVDAELGLQGGGLFTFPVILLLLLAAYYHETLLVLASSLLAHGSEATRHIFAAATSVRGAGAADDAPLRRKKKAFKEQ